MPRRSCRNRVYPRACGGTLAFTLIPLMFAGLSPRVRGNHALLDIDAEARGSIPARAGEPLIAAPLAIQNKVYPRACGGTPSRLGGPGRAPGLSPRVRGNRLSAPVRHPYLGSIPARAGEPQ